MFKKTTGIRGPGLANLTASGPGVRTTNVGGRTIISGDGLPRKGGFNFRVLESGISITEGSEPTTEQYQTALQNCYLSTAGGDNPITPRRGDLISLRYSTGSRLIARFLLLEDDQAAPTATVRFEYPAGESPPRYWYALNMTYSSVEQLIDAIQDYLAGPNGGQNPDGRDIEPAAEGSFQLSVNGIYDTSEDGFWIPAVGNPVLGCLGGTVVLGLTPSGGSLEAPATGVDTNEYSFPSVDGIKSVGFALKVVANLGATSTGSKAIQSIHSATIIHGTGPGSVAATDWQVISSTQCVRRFHIGTVRLLRRGNRRGALITQALAGNLNLLPDGTAGTPTDTHGNDVRDGLRQLAFNLNGKPYTGYFLVAGIEAVPES